MRVATDVGGTFTDLVYYDESTGGFGATKSDTTPPNLERGVLDTIEKAGLDASTVEYFAHGSTVVINALTERKGVRTGLITTKGFRESEWLDTAGNPITDAATMTERITRPNFGTLNLAITIDDPKAYTKPFTIDMNMKIMIDTQMIEEFCLENERDSARLLAPSAAKP